MRISDWSSDVCSSDLERQDEVVLQVEAAVRAAGAPGCADHQPQHAVAPAAHGLVVALGQQVVRSEERRVGKSVSVRVDLGGRRIIKKKNNSIVINITIKHTAQITKNVTHITLS